MTAVLVVNHFDYAGLTSHLSVRLTEACRFRVQQGVWPTDIDSSGQFGLYKQAGEDFAKRLLAGISNEPPPTAIPFHHEQQWSWYAELPIDDIRSAARAFCWPSDEVLGLSQHIQRRMKGRVGVLYRGNDKAREIDRAPYEQFYSMADETGGERFWVQTDEKGFLRSFRKRFPETDYLRELPQMRFTANKHVTVKVRRSRRPDFGIWFLAALHALGQSPMLLTTTGNTGLWTTIFRGHTNGVWQHSGREGRFVSS